MSESLVDEVYDLLGEGSDYSKDVIRNDLKITGSAQETLNRIFDGLVKKDDQLLKKVTDPTDPAESFPIPMNINPLEGNINTRIYNHYSPMDTTKTPPSSKEQASHKASQNISPPDSPDYLEMIDVTPKKKKNTEMIRLDLSDDEEEHEPVAVTSEFSLPDLPSPPSFSASRNETPKATVQTNGGHLTVDFSSYTLDEIQAHKDKVKQNTKKLLESYAGNSNSNQNQATVPLHLEANSYNVAASFTPAKELNVSFHNMDSMQFLIQRPKNPSHSEMILLVDEGLTETSETAKSALSNLHSYLKMNKRYVFPMITRKLSIPQSIEWRRISRPKFRTDQMELLITLDASLLAESTVDEFLIIPMVVADLYDLAKQNKLEPYCDQVRKFHPTKQITLLVIGVNRWSKSQSSSEAVEILEDAVVWLQFESGLYYHQSETNVSAASFIELFTESIAEAMYKTESKFERFCAEAVGKNPSGDPRHVWVLQLKQIKGISEPVAWAVAKRFPTIQTMAQFLSQSHLSEQQKLNTIANLPIENRNQTVGPKRSKQIYQLFTEEIPTELAL